MRNKTRQLLHLAALALLLYFFALAARAFGALVALPVFLVLGLLFECRFWWKLLTPDREESQRANR